MFNFGNLTSRNTGTMRNINVLGGGGEGSVTITNTRGNNNNNATTIIVNGKILKINGKTYKGRVKIIAEDETIADEFSTGCIEIKISGDDVGDITVEGAAEIHIGGSANNVNNANGNVDVGGNVTGSVEVSNGSATISGDVVEGNVTASNGNVNCKNVKSGKVKASNGNVYHN